MAKYELPEFQSVYRDTGAIQVNQLKRQEYLANMQADNALATSVMNMDALDQDRDKLENLAELYNGNINKRAQRKDYENLGMSISKDAMNFVKDYSPIKRQIDIRAGFKSSLDEAVKAKRINQLTANKLLAESDYNYKGVQTSPSGIVDRDSFYKGSGFVADVDVNKLMQDEMKDFVERFAKTQTWSLVDDQLIPVKDSSGQISYKVKTTAEDYTIPKEDVLRISNNVLSRPEVLASIGQQARLDTYRSGEILDGETKSEATVGIERNIQDSKKRIREIEKLLAKGEFNNEQIADAQKEIADLSKSIAFETDYLKSGKDPVPYYKTIKTLEIARGHQDFFVGKYSYLNQVRKSDIVKQGEGEGNEYTKYVPSLFTNLPASEDLANTVSGGLTVESINFAKAENQNTLDTIYNRFNSNESNPGLNNPDVLDQLLSVNGDEDIDNIKLFTASGAELDRTAVVALVNNAKRADDNLRLLNRRLQEAVASVHGDMVLPDGSLDQEKYNAYINNFYNNEVVRFANRNRIKGEGQYQYDDVALSTISYPDITKAMKALGLIDQNANTKQALDVLMESPIVKGTNDFQGDPIEYPQIGDKVMQQVLGDDYNTVDKAELQEYIRDLTNYSRNYEEQDAERIQEHLNNQEIKMLYSIDGNYGDPTKKTESKITEAIKEGFSNNMVVYAAGSSEPISINQWLIENNLATTGTFTKPEKGDITGVEGEGYEIIPAKSGLVTVANQSGEPMIAVAVKDKNTEETKFVFMPAGQLDVKYAGVSKMQEYTNSTAFKLMRLFNTGEAYNVTSDTPSIPGMKVRFNYANPSEPIEITGQGLDTDPESPTYNQIIERTKAYPKEQGLDQIEAKLESSGLGYLLH